MEEEEDYSSEDATEPPAKKLSKEQQGWFTVPSGKRPRPRTPPNPPTTPTNNRFTPLEPKESEETRNEEEKPTKPPPIVIKGTIKNFPSFEKSLKEEVGEDFTIKFGRNVTFLNINDSKKKEKFQELLEQKQVEFHTYTPRNEKTHAFVCRGLDHEPDPQDILRELTLKKVPVKQVYRLNGTTYPLYMVVTNSEITLGHLKQQIKFLNKIKVSWERKINKRVLTQCHRCQRWCHATSNCRAIPKCLKCADNHWTKDCPAENPRIKCANCSGEHLANYVECPAYLSKLEHLNRNKRTPEPPKFVPAPPPKLNVWEQRRQSRETTKSAVNVYTSSAIAVPPHQGKSNEPTNKMNELNQLIHEIDEIIDIDFMIHKLQELKNKLQHCSTKAEQFTCYFNFTKELNNIQP